MLNQYSIIQDGLQVCQIFNLPNELQDYKVEVVIKPISIPKNKNFENFKESLKKYSYDLPSNFKFNREEIYKYLDE